MADVSDSQFWDSVSDRLEMLRQLDAGCKLVFGANRHRYDVLPVCTDSVIEEYEQSQGVTLHENYRNYLKYFGCGGAGPGYGIDRFPDKVWQTELASPLLLEEFHGVQELDAGSKNESLEQLHGMIRIGTSGNPSSYYFVQTGQLAGNVILYNHDIVVLYGLFHEWVSRWVDESIRDITNLPLLKDISIGMQVDDVIGLIDLEYTISFGSRLNFEGLPANIIFDDNRIVTKINVEKSKPSNVGFGFLYL